MSVCHFLSNDIFCGVESILSFLLFDYFFSKGGGFMYHVGFCIFERENEGRGCIGHTYCLRMSTLEYLGSFQVLDQHWMNGYISLHYAVEWHLY